MSLLRIAEVFGYPIDNHTGDAQKCRDQRRCRFVGGPCTKGGTRDPLGICSLGDDQHAAILCPRRFLENDRVFLDAGKLAFGSHAQFVAVPELRVLRVPGNPRRRIGKVDYVLGNLGSSGEVIDFAALEVQAVYFSGQSVRPAFAEFMRTGHWPDATQRRPDWRSSAQKRLMPQLALKVPIFRRWGKKFFVAVDSLFFDALPTMNTVDAIANSEVTWLVYPVEYQRDRRVFLVGSPRVVFTTWEDVAGALREGAPPSPNEVLEELRGRHRRGTVRKFYA